MRLGAVALVLGVLVLAGAARAGSDRTMTLRVEQEGLPKDGYEEGELINSRTTARASFSVAKPLETTSLRTQRVRGSFLIEHADSLITATPSGEPGTRVLRLRLRARNIRLTSFADGTRALLFTAWVVGSNDPECPVGRRGPMLISDDARGVDVMRMVVCPYDHEHYFQRGVRGLLRVRIG